MNKLFVPYELALLAKEKGFDEQCLAFYRGVDKVFAQDMIKGRNKNSLFVDATSITSPLYQQLIDWFREKYKLEVFVIANDAGKFWYGVGWLGDENGTTEDSSENPSDDWYYEMENGLEEAFKLI